MPVTSPTFVRNRDLLEAELGDELVALDVADGLCFGFNPVAAAVWKRLKQPISLERLVAELTAEYDVSADQCTQEVRNLLNLMVERQLVRTAADL